MTANFYKAFLSPGFSGSSSFSPHDQGEMTLVPGVKKAVTGRFVTGMKVLCQGFFDAGYAGAGEGQNLLQWCAGSSLRGTAGSGSVVFVGLDHACRPYPFSLFAAMFLDKILQLQ
jgi:hypothetical protein